MGNDTLTMAMHYLKRGFSLIPINFMDKRPMIEWAEFQKRRPTETELREWFQGDRANIGIVTGPISNLAVIDLDDDVSIELFQQYNFPESCMVQTHRGFHIFYRYHPSIKTAVHLHGLKMDIRSMGGYVVAPPSINNVGVQYKWVEGYGLDDLSVSDFPIEFLTKFQSRGKSTTDTSMAELYTGVSEGQRNASLTRLMGSWLKDGLSEAECLAMADIWNTRNHPPLPDNEIVATTRGLFKRYADQRASQPTDLITLGNLLNEPEEEIPWLIKDTLPMGGSSIVVAKPKVGKSTIVRQAMLNVARGEPFLDRETISGPAIYLALEEKRSEIRRHFKDMGAKGTELIYLCVSIGRQDPLACLKTMIEKIKPVWVVIDPLFKFIDVKDGNSYSEMSKAIERIHGLARDNNIHITLVHHASKSDRSGGDGILGSTAIFGGIDTTIIMKSAGKSRTIYTIQRYGVDIDETVLTFDPATRMSILGASQATAASVSLEQAIIDFLKLQSQPISEDTINQNVKGNSMVRYSALREAVKKGVVEKTGEGKRGNPYLYRIKCSDSVAVPGPHAPEAINFFGFDFTKPPDEAHKFIEFSMDEELILS